MSIIPKNPEAADPKNPEELAGRGQAQISELADELEEACRLGDLAEAKLIAIHIQQSFGHIPGQIYDRALIEGCREYHQDIIDWAWEKGAQDYTLAVHWAAFGGHRDLIDSLARRAAGELWEDPVHQEILEGVCLGGHLALAIQYFERFRAEGVDGELDYNRALMAACTCGHRPTIEWLLSLKCPDNGREYVDDVCHGIYGASAGGHIDVLKWLIDTYEMETEAGDYPVKDTYESILDGAESEEKSQVLYWLYIRAQDKGLADLFDLEGRLAQALRREKENLITTYRDLFENPVPPSRSL